MDSKGDQRRIDDNGIANLREPIVILGEPGSGKSRLLRHISSQNNAVLRSAAAFVTHPNPALLVQRSSILLIDGLDELAAAHESEPVNRVLSQLIRAGCPPFILSCRVADWRGAIAREDITQEYGVSPKEFFLEPLSRAAAVEFLSTSLPAERAEALVQYFESKGIPDLYGNPLSLSLFGEVAAVSSELPNSRADLMKRACEVMWQEKSDRHDMSALSSIGEDAALDAAGAAAAALLLTGSETIGITRSAAPRAGSLGLPDIQSLPQATHVRPIIGSRLFTRAHGTTDQVKPVHRSVAEYLGARWLARIATNELQRERLLSFITIDSGVPASLRGLYAWLPHFDARFASTVIATDPYGLLRYGDADGLSVNQGRDLLHSLQRLEIENPFFRAEDWTRHSAKGLIHPELRDDIREILLSTRTTTHLRSLILEAIRDSRIATDLASDLLAILLKENGREFGFRERHDAASAIMKLRDTQTEWPGLCHQLASRNESDSKRLAVSIMDDVNYVDFSSKQIAEAVLALFDFDKIFTDETESFVPGELYFVAKNVPASAIEQVLDELSSRLAQVKIDENLDWEQYGELSTFINRLIVRRIEADKPNPLKLLNWLRIVRGRPTYVGDEARQIADFLLKHEEIRRAIQYQVIFVEQLHERVGSRLWRMRELNSGLSLNADDVLYFLTRMAALERPTERDDEIWRDLANFARHIEERAEEILSAARPFAMGKPLLEAYLSDLALPPPIPDWQVRENERRESQQKKKRDAWAKHRKDFKENEAALRHGELRWTFGIANSYLGLFSDSDKTLSPPDRIGEWLGPELQVAGLAGLDATLSRADIPTLQQVAESYADSRRWNYIYPLIAAAAERVRTGRGLDKLPSDLTATIRLALHHEPLRDRIDTETLTTQLEIALRRDPTHYERYIRLLIEPALEKKLTYIPGLYALSKSEESRPLISRLAAEWLFQHKSLPLAIEDQFVGILADADDFKTLRSLSVMRAQAGFCNDEHRQAWLANGIVFNFEETAGRMPPPSDSDMQLLWLLRDRIHGRRPQKRIPPLLSPTQYGWIIRRFRHLYPATERPSGVSSGDQNPWDATEFLKSLVNALATDMSDSSGALLRALSNEPEDGYTPHIRFATDQHRQARREARFDGVTLANLRAVLELGPPTTTSDLLVIIRHSINHLQRQLRGSDTDIVGKYYRDEGSPRDEDSCTDRLIEDLERLLPRHGISAIPQRDMPNRKRVDVVFAMRDFALPMECKGQWNRDLWSAANEQLDALYLLDWRSQDRGLLLVYWFGTGVQKAHRLRRPPTGMRAPETPEELRESLLDLVPLERRSSIAIEVLDLTRPSQPSTR